MARDPISNYFDLRSRPGAAAPAAEAPATGSPAEGAVPPVNEDEPGGKRPPAVWPQWLALTLGVVIQPFLSNYRETGRWPIPDFEPWGWLIFALIVAVILFPAIYRNAFDPTKPIFVQMIPIFTSGLGWEALFGAAVKAGGGG
ncbi:MAG TPA: hypothetical protein VKZ43_08610 [Trueperaceae bacterium]|nr:hypothetical protein [Trueperaceae bacterium]